MRIRLVQKKGPPPGPFLRFGTHATVPTACVDMHRLRAELTIENKSIVKQQAMRGGDADPRTRLWTEAGGSVTVPRGYSIPFLPGLRPRYTHFDRTREVVTGPWRFTRKLRDAQRAPAAALRRQAGDKLLCLGCVSGDTELQLNRAGKGFRVSIAEAYSAFHRLAPRGGKFWREDIPTMIRSKVGDRVGLQLVENIVYSGVKETFTLRLVDGKELRLTGDHEVLTPDGFVRLAHLRAGDAVLVDGEREGSARAARIPYRRLSWYSAHPFARVQQSEGRWRYQIEEHRAVYEASINGLSLAAYRATLRSGRIDGLRFVDPRVWHVHHVDENPRNNSVHNLQLLPAAAHRTHHHPGYPAFGYGVPTAVEIEEIKSHGFEDTYDVQCAAPFHNFVANGVIIHNCGKGKTTLALEYAAEKGLRTLVIVDRDFLLTQWTKEIEACGITDAASVGRVQGPKLRVGERITLAMVHTLAQKDFGADFYDQFGLIVVDEAHVMAAPTFGTVIPRFRGERLILTATPTRVDGMHPVFMLHAGGMKPCYTDLSRDQSASWVFAELPPLLSEQEMARCQRRVPGRYRYRWDPVQRASVREPVTMLNRAVYDTKAAASEAFNRIILSEIAKSLEAGRHSLVLGSRVEQLEVLAAACIEAGVDASVVTSHVKGKKRDAAFTKQVLFVTSSIGNKALDVPRLDTLYMLFPNADPGFVRQAVGRIDRALADKRAPVVVVFSHAAVPSLRKKAGEMLELVRGIDPKAEVRRVRRS